MSTPSSMHPVWNPYESCPSRLFLVSGYDSSTPVLALQGPPPVDAAPRSLQKIFLGQLQDAVNQMDYTRAAIAAVVGSDQIQRVVPIWKEKKRFMDCHCCFVLVKEEVADAFIQKVNGSIYFGERETLIACDALGRRRLREVADQDAQRLRCPRGLVVAEYARSAIR